MYTHNAMKERNAALLLLLTSLIWGLSFVAQSVSSESIGPFTFNAVRLIIGALVLIPFAFPGIKKHKGDRKYFQSAMKGGSLCGLLLAAASVSQQAGVAVSGAGKGGFITSLYIIIVPILSILTGRKTTLRTWLCAVVALIGMYFLTLSEGLSLSSGDTMLILCAFIFALHIMAIDKVGKDVDGVLLSMIQFFIGGVISGIGMFIFEKPEASAILEAWLPVFYAGAFSCGIAYTLQIVGQKYMNPDHAVLILSLESVWAAIGGALILSERMTGKELLGCVLVFAAVIVSQMNFKIKTISE